MTRELQPCVVRIPADGLTCIDRKLGLTQVKVRDKMSLATVSVQGESRTDTRW